LLELTELNIIAEIYIKLVIIYLNLDKAKMEFDILN